eukprot:Hpha_TRINITY_DN19744_c0_g1::TRINITY_DN19744_c0_g1_i1::g.21853::m.21853
MGVMGWAVGGVCCGAAAVVSHRTHSYHPEGWHHSLHSKPKTRMSYNGADVGDYAFMLLATHTVAIAFFGEDHPFIPLSMWACVILFCLFPVRHGATWRVPLVLSAPWELVEGVLLYRVRNIRPAPLVAVGTACLEQAVIAATPHWPHYSEEYQAAAWAMFYGVFALVTAVRVVALMAHVWKRGHVFEFLADTHWGSKLGTKGGARGLADLSHAFCTGVSCHLLAMCPLYLMLSLPCSVVVLPFRLAVDACMLQQWWGGDFADWLYRDHWVCHHSEAAFVYLHAPHHDAIPVSLMAAHDTGMLEGFLRFAIGQPDAYLNPLLAVAIFGFSVVADMVFHQYVPGVFPYSSNVVRYGHHHMEHHFLSLHPLGPGFEHPPDGNLSNDVRIDQRLGGYKPDNAVWTWFCERAKQIEGIRKRSPSVGGVH